MSLKTSIVVVLTLLLVISVTTFAFATPKYGAKAYGMGGAFTAVADDASAIYWNPAGLVQSGFIGAEFSIGADPDDDFIDDAKDVLDMPEGPEQYKALYDLNSTQMGLDGMFNANFKNVGIGALLTNSFTYNNDDNLELRNRLDGQGVISTGIKLLEPPMNIGALYVGANLKGLWSRYDSVTGYNSGGSGTTEEGEASATGYGLDIGMMAKVTDAVNFGLSVKNATSDLDWEWDKKPINPAKLDDSLPRTVTAGTAIKLPYPLSATIAADIESIEDGEDIYHVGFEKNILFNGLSLRAGMYKPENGDEVITGGLGLNLANLHANLAMDDEGYYALSANLKF
ncbi:PorV/PorQ family protein [Selenihalanaerobacter shriftii]|uniref:Uncharacterized protein n=1 Tax=Selenihalanaerobacter shriftii TaxID=142842 RepID=A0A1T4LH98_9FIRM|nr:hypothetical protein [Selenihalanaerobacter shriftii]SJZ53917.1 hypothetical protein SAMN02745118_01134 [Selenihalanaerobacter shriftii]